MEIKKICGSCEHYKMIDSGYGECKRFPPKTEYIKKWFRIKYYTSYPEVTWDDKCGEHKWK